MIVKKSEGGFTLVEILVGIAVAGVIVGTLSQVTTTYVHVSQRGRYLNLANSFIEAKVEAMRNAGYSTLSNGTTSLTSSLPGDLPPSKSASMTISSPLGGIKQVDLAVSFKDQGSTRTYNYTTYIGELGVGQ
jgi:prepilin-type N-terminal cleavage/methylation domain-containing protein